MPRDVTFPVKINEVFMIPLRGSVEAGSEVCIGRKNTDFNKEAFATDAKLLKLLEFI